MVAEVRQRPVGRAGSQCQAESVIIVAPGWSLQNFNPPESLCWCVVCLLQFKFESKRRSKLEFASMFQEAEDAECEDTGHHVSLSHFTGLKVQPVTRSSVYLTGQCDGPFGPEALKGPIC